MNTYSISVDSTSYPTLAMCIKHGVPERCKTTFYHISYWTRKLLELGSSTSEVEAAMSGKRMELNEQIMFDLMEEGWHPDRIRFLLGDIWDAQERSMLAHAPPTKMLIPAAKAAQGGPETNPTA